MWLILTILFCGVAAESVPVVQTRLGEVRGVSTDDYHMFLGVPYALVDEQNPFASAVPHPNYDGPIEAFTDDIVCPQPLGLSPVEPLGTVQCLVLNVFVPKVADHTLLPVMVWIHGGAFVVGSGTRVDYDPIHLLKHDVIVVSLNYRLGMYGFLCTDSAKSPGNTGLKDQVLGLRWVRENIEAFGGDPTKITAFGESAGAMSVHLHLFSPHEQLLDRVIIQSGSAVSPWAFVDANNSVPISVAKELGYQTEDFEDALDFLAKSDVSDVVGASAKLLIATADDNNQPLTKACVEKEFEGIERFVIEHPSLAHSDKAKNTDIIIGHNSQEMIFQYASEPEEFFYNYSFLDRLALGFNVTDFEDMAAIVRRFYIGDEAAGPNLEEEITTFASDFIWNYPAERKLKRLLEDEAKVVYKYLFSYVGNRNVMRLLVNPTLPGASHMDELGYLFDMPFLNLQETTAEDQQMIDRMTTLWTNFAKYGNPLPEPTTLLPVPWTPVSQESQPYLEIDREMRAGARTFHERTAFWDLFYEANLHRVKGHY